jgi:hydroxymethylglutaryl-CoA lyase
MKIIECPRDAMQGLSDFVPTETKIDYINSLLKVGFDTIDFGSFVSPKAIPQMRDTAKVLAGLDLSITNSKLLAIIANMRGAVDAAGFEEIQYLGFPLSISETFQQRNTNKSIIEALNELEQIQNLCKKTNKTLVVYLSMGFGNPYNEPFNEEIVTNFTSIMATMGVEIVSLSDTIGVAQPDLIGKIFKSVIAEFPNIEIGAHFHSTPGTAIDKIEAAYEAGCKRFDGALKGFGGCPMAKDELTGNIATEAMVSYFEAEQVELNLDKKALKDALITSLNVFK